MTNTQLLMAALAYAQCGNWREVAESIGTITKDGVRIAVTRAADHNPLIFSALVDGRILSEQLCKKKRATADCFKPKYHVRSDLALKRHREIHNRRTSQPSPVTLGQKLMGEPLPGRSALDKVETDGRGNITEKPPTILTRKRFPTDRGRYNNVTLAPISIPSIGINNNHSQ